MHSLYKLQTTTTTPFVEADFHDWYNYINNNMCLQMAITKPLQQQLQTTPPLDFHLYRYCCTPQQTTNFHSPTTTPTSNDRYITTTTTATTNLFCWIDPLVRILLHTTTNLIQLQHSSNHIHHYNTPQAMTEYHNHYNSNYYKPLLLLNWISISTDTDAHKTKDCYVTLIKVCGDIAVVCGTTTQQQTAKVT